MLTGLPLTRTWKSSEREREMPGGDIHPSQISSPGASRSTLEDSNGINLEEVDPNKSYNRSSIPSQGGQSRTFLPSISTNIPVFGSLKAKEIATSTIAAFSVDALL